MPLHLQCFVFIGLRERNSKQIQMVKQSCVPLNELLNNDIENIKSEAFILSFVFGT